MPRRIQKTGLVRSAAKRPSTGMLNGTIPSDTSNGIASPPKGARRIVRFQNGADRCAVLTADGDSIARLQRFRQDVPVIGERACGMLRVIGLGYGKRPVPENGRRDSETHKQCYCQHDK